MKDPFPTRACPGARGGFLGLASHRNHAAKYWFLARQMLSLSVLGTVNEVFRNLKILKLLMTITFSDVKIGLL